MRTAALLSGFFSAGVAVGYMVRGIVTWRRILSFRQ